MNISIRQFISKINGRAFATFFITLILCCTLIFIAIVNRTDVEQLKMEQLISQKTAKANDTLSRLLYKTDIIAASIKKNNGRIEDFERLAIAIVDDPAILNIIAAPNGIVEYVYPLEGNESVLGLDFFSDGLGNKEAIMAKETEQLVFGGPFLAVQGYEILVGRQPVFIDGPSGKEFWGIASVTLKYPEALEAAGFKELQIQGFAYEIWRINPDDGQKQIILNSDHDYNNKTNFIEREVSISNTSWFFRILPVKMWYEFPETWGLVLIALFISFLSAFLVQSNYELNSIKCKLDMMAHTDSLTGVPNRRHFMANVEKHITLALRNNYESFIIIFDYDHFKDINDRLGHNAGDRVLKETAVRVSGVVRPYDLFARYGGEEFILFVSNTDKETAVVIAERIRNCITNTDVEYKGEKIKVTASAGIAQVTPVNSLDVAISLADAALYAAKDSGRNTVKVAD